MKSVPEPLIDELKTYFTERIKHCFDMAIADFFERKVDDEFWKLISEIETYLIKKKPLFIKLETKTHGLTGGEYYIDKLLKNLPVQDNRFMPHRTNEGMDYRLCISILLAIDVFEQNKLKDLIWLKNLLVKLNSDLTKDPPSAFGYLRDKMPFPSVSAEETEDALKWKKDLKYTLKRRLFGKAGKEAETQFYKKLRKSPEYKWTSFFPSSISHGETEIDDYYLKRLLLKQIQKNKKL